MRPILFFDNIRVVEFWHFLTYSQIHTCVTGCSCNNFISESRDVGYILDWIASSNIQLYLSIGFLKKGGEDKKFF